MRHIRSLDGLRGVAVLAVLAMHAAFATPTAGRDLADALTFQVLGYGWLGVDCFFVLSGYLITTILLNYRRQMNAGRSLWLFYARRGMRIMPIYYLYLLAVLVLSQRSDQHLRELGWLATYTQNVFWPLYGSTLWPWVGHLWSLAIEQHFYLVWPLIVLLVKPRILPIVIAVLILCPPALRCVLLNSDWMGSIYMSSVTRADSLLAGAWLACLHMGLVPRLGTWFARHARLVCAACFGVFVGAQVWFRLAADNAFNLSLGYTIFALGCAGLIHILSESRGRVTRALERPAIVAMGRISYGVYLYHMAVFVILKVVFSNWMPGWRAGSYLFDFFTFLLVAGGATYGIAWLSYRYVERPLLDARPGRGDAPQPGRDPRADDREGVLQANTGPARP